MAEPIVVIQMQRLGDLVLTFPLLLWLARQYPGHPVWLRAEPAFAALARGLAPPVRLLGPEHDPELQATPARLVVHLGHAAAGAALAEAVPAQQRLGLVRQGAALRVHGFWQRYRTALSHANRHNRFHWAELFALDLVPLGLMAATRWDPPRTNPVGKIGLFLGASDPAKAPGPAFWAGVAGHLRRLDLAPVLLGGPAEVPVAQEVRRLLRRPVIDLCGALTVERLAYLGQELSLLITPDTGPMHAAAWTGLRVLNLSVGPVWPWDTGPYQPGHLVLQAARSCRGCWACPHAAPPCHLPLAPRQVAALAAAVVAGEPWQAPAGLRLAVSGRDACGLYALEHQGGHQPCAREALGRYWQAFWLALGAEVPEALVRQRSQDLWAVAPKLARSLTRASLELLRQLPGWGAPPLPWQQAPPALRPLTSFLAVVLESEDLAPQARRQALATVERHLALLAP